MNDKAAMRKAARARRAEAYAVVDIAPATTRLLEVLANKAGPVAFYWPMRTEIDPRPVMGEIAGAKPVCLPVTHGMRPLTFRSWHPGIAMEKDSFGTEFPGDGPEVTPLTLVVPLLAFDRRGHRLGYGAGHYDRTLAGLSGEGPVTAIGYAFAAQEVQRIPDEPTDKPLDVIVTEREAITPG